ncbi:unnamed protein product [Eruca vesicaria subsp. sativa]|uniref:Bifunctional inhibitor/plant lipid transfer protein/seed storage helical domain-containing protein n=1 Tax=Eruca vesicaria subsp. sativa TaxID=29727 RepID=A0ABC8LNF7_ERUVS|nr:unnamed protein product [Eruca vesicaria subsp. sativa]
MKFAGAVCISFVLVLASSLDWTNAAVEEEIKVECVPAELISCMPAILTGSAPTTECCGKLKEQESCLCSYIQNSAFGPYIKSPNAHKVLEGCGIPYPTC